MKGTPLFTIIRTRAFVTSKDGQQNTTQVAPHYSLPLLYGLTFSSCVLHDDSLCLRMAHYEPSCLNVPPSQS
jgi:hypothetical protein